MTNSVTIEQIIADAKSRNSTRLSFQNLDEIPDDIPDDLYDLRMLQDLDLGNIPVKFINKKIKKLVNLKSLVISKADFDLFPIDLIGLPKLKDLTLTSPNLTELPKLLDTWRSLEYLNLDKCVRLSEIKGIPPNLTYLNISNNAYSDWPKKISTLKYINKLVASNLNLSEIPIEIFSLTNLQALFLGDNNISLLSNKILNLSKLRELVLSNNQFKEIPKFIGQLKMLKKLVLNGNKITKIPEYFKNLKLSVLELGSNRLKEIPQILLEINSLKELGFGNYSFYTSDEKKNLITEIPEDISRLNNLIKLDVFQNDIENVPPEIIQEGIEAIKNFFHEKAIAETEEFLYEAKMVIVGRGNVGKTVLTRRLTDPTYVLSKSASTPGISVLKNPFHISIGDQEDIEFKFNIWDFGGQEKYDATHQLFITNRSIYLFLTEAREESNYLDFYYWLNTISLFSKNSPVIVVLSKYDERRKLIPESIYKEKFKNIVRFVDVSCAIEYGHTIEKLRSVIKEAVELLPQTKQKLSNKWIDIRHELQELSKLKDYITYDEYLTLCDSHGLNKKRADFLSQYLNDLGVIIHHQNDLLLRKTVFLNTDWCVDGIYKVLDDESVFVNNGKFTNDHLSTIWEDRRFEAKQAELLKLMHSYKLCFELKDGSGFIAPDLLPPDKSISFKWDYSSNLHFEYRYEFMPAGILSRFIVKSHSIIKDNLFWKYGVVLKYDNTEALVEEDYIHSKLKISLVGINKKGLLSAIRMYLEEVHKDFDKSDKLLYEEMVPCNCSECQLNSNPHFYKFNVLTKFETKNIKILPCEKSSEPVEISSLINDVAFRGFGYRFETNKDLKEFIYDIITKILNHDVIYKGGYNNFWRDSNCESPKNEVEVQPFIANTIDHYCKANGVQLSREVYEANGSVDVLFSFTNHENEILKVCLEIKKAHHQHVDVAVNTQLPQYMKSAGTDAGIYLVIWYKNEVFNQPANITSEEHLESIISNNNTSKTKISTFVLNVNKKASPSMIKLKN